MIAMRGIVPASLKIKIGMEILKAWIVTTRILIAFMETRRSVEMGLIRTVMALSCPVIQMEMGSSLTEIVMIWTQGVFQATWRSAVMRSIKIAQEMIYAACLKIWMETSSPAPLRSPGTAIAASLRVWTVMIWITPFTLGRWSAVGMRSIKTATAWTSPALRRIRMGMGIAL